MKRFLITVMILLGLFIVMQCARNSGNPVGDDYLQRQYDGDQLYAVFYPAPTDTFFQTYINSGISPYLYLGQSRDIESKFLMHFEDLPDSGTIVQKAVLTLHTHRVFGDPNGFFIASISEILDEWVEEDITWESFETSGLLGSEVTTRKISADEITSWDDTLTLNMTIPTRLVQSWINNKADSANHGLLFSVSTPASFIVEFYSRNVPNLEEKRPVLTLITSADSVEESIPVSSEKDGTISMTNRPATSEFLHIGNGTALRSLLYFSVGDSIPVEATINRALLKMYADPDQAFPNKSETFEIFVHHATDSPWPFPDVPFDSTFKVTGAILKDSTWMHINVSPLIQSWTFGTAENHGLILKGKREADDLLERVFHSTACGDSSLLPHLEIFYTLPPSSRL